MSPPGGRVEEREAGPWWVEVEALAVALRPGVRGWKALGLCLAVESECPGRLSWVSCW